MMKNKWYIGQVIEGKGIGKTLGFPTINLDNPAMLTGKPEGVYAVLVKIGNKIYKGVLYYGPRLIISEKENILEIFIFDFNREIYSEKVKFRLYDFIRGVKKFAGFTEFKKQLREDSRQARKILLK